MHGKTTLTVLTAALLGSAVLTPVSAFAAPQLPSCSQLAALLASNSNIVKSASDNEGIPSPTATIVPATATNAAYCNVQFEFSSKSGPADGYAPGKSQAVGIGVGLPLNTTDGGTPSNPSGATWNSVNGAWNGSVQNIGGGGQVGSVGSTVSATNGGYVGSSTDGGHNKAQVGTLGNFGVIQATHQYDTGRLNDFGNEAIHQQYLWSLWLANQYYGQPAQRNYWNGCSTGSRQGFGLAEQYGEDFDGFALGAPAIRYNDFWLAIGWAGLVNRDDVVGAGHPAITNNQYNNVIDHAVAACDVMGTDVVADGVIDDPRACQYSAVGDPSVLAAPDGTCTGANCIDKVQAAAIEKMWAGVHNHFGRKVWHGFQNGVHTGGNMNISTVLSTGTSSPGTAVALDHIDLTFSPQNLYTTRALAAANPLNMPSPVAIEDEFVRGSTSVWADIMKMTDFPGIIKNVYQGHKQGKIMLWQGGADNQNFYQDSIEYYREMATLFGHGKPDFAGLSTWFRYYHAPGVGHCTTGPGASPIGKILPNGQTQFFQDLVDWVEKGKIPQSAGNSTKLGILSTGPGTFGTRPSCPWPTTAIYNGSGDTKVASNYHCGGNLDTNIALLCAGLHTEDGRKSSNNLDYAAQGVNPGLCESQGHDNNDNDQGHGHE